VKTSERVSRKVYLSPEKDKAIRVDRAYNLSPESSAKHLNLPVGTVRARLSQLDASRKMVSCGQ
jgi:DNA-directed RNA polymerase specialized sigma24 family protein